MESLRNILDEYTFYTDLSFQIFRSLFANAIEPVILWPLISCVRSITVHKFNQSEVRSTVLSSHCPAVWEYLNPCTRLQQSFHPLFSQVPAALPPMKKFQENVNLLKCQRRSYYFEANFRKTKTAFPCLADIVLN